jgi:hypothetical protein
MRHKLLVIAAICAVLAVPAKAFTVNMANPFIQVTPYPVPYTFSSGDAENTTMNLSYAGSTQNGVNLNGGGIDVGYRRTISDNLAWDAMFSVYGLFASPNDSEKISVVPVPLSTHIEYDAWRNDSADLLLFAGPNVTISNLNDKAGINVANNTTSTIEDTVLMYGLQFGAQLGVNMGNNGAKFIPYVMVAPTWGRYSYNDATSSDSTSMGCQLMTSVGAKLMFSPTFGLNVTYQTMGSNTQTVNGINFSYNSYHNLVLGMNFAL